MLLKGEGEWDQQRAKVKLKVTQQMEKRSTGAKFKVMFRENKLLSWKKEKYFLCVFEEK